MSTKLVKVSEHDLKSRAWELHHEDLEHEEVQRVGSRQGQRQGNIRFSDLQTLKQHESDVIKTKRALAQVAESPGDTADG